MAGKACWKIGGLLATAGLLSPALTLADDTQRMEEGRTAYEAACASCHDTGTSGAPVTRRTEDWTGRSPLWEAVLFEHANSGYLKMPAKGGKNSLPEYDVDAAAEYMLTVTRKELPAD